MLNCHRNRQPLILVFHQQFLQKINHLLAISFVENDFVIRLSVDDCSLQGLLFGLFEWQFQSQAVVESHSERPAIYFLIVGLSLDHFGGSEVGIAKVRANDLIGRRDDDGATDT